ncbi:MAG TPA: divergent polysaccharide deacetylase family protein [Stellaceae bacterium]|nr:divergent polysaccharide deacetylase family protein [Stellaceae bacterium]
MASVASFVHSTVWLPRSPRSLLAHRNLLLAVLGALLAATIALAWLTAAPPAPQVVVAEIQAAAKPSATPPPAAPAATPAPQPPTAAPAPAQAVIALTPAPDPALIEKNPYGWLPTKSPDGRQAWMVYARPFDRSGKQPRIAMVISGLGLSKLTTQNAIRNLPPEVTLSFMPYHTIAAMMEEARAAGHETLIDVPMEPLDYPRQDPGPEALLVALDPAQNLDRLHWMMGRGTGYVGMMTYMGSRFAATPEQLRPILGDIKGRGLAFVDARSTADGTAMKLAAEMKLPRGAADRVLDTDLSRSGIEQQLGELETLARRNGSAIGVGAAYPLTIQAVATWSARLAERGIVLAPLSAVLVP